MDLVRDKKKRNLTPVVYDQRFRQMELPSGTPEKGRIKKKNLDHKSHGGNGNEHNGFLTRGRTHTDGNGTTNRRQGKVENLYLN